MSARPSGLGDGRDFHTAHHDDEQASVSRQEWPLSLPAALAPDTDSGQAARAAPVFVALTDLANLRAAGIAYPSTIHAWRWLFRHRHERGLDDAFRRIGRRIVVDPQRYRELVRESAEA